jgi:hypothetical protein
VALRVPGGERNQLARLLEREDCEVEDPMKGVIEIPFAVQTGEGSAQEEGAGVLSGLSGGDDDACLCGNWSGSVPDWANAIVAAVAFPSKSRPNFAWRLRGLFIDTCVARGSSQTCPGLM